MNEITVNSIILYNNKGGYSIGQINNADNLKSFFNGNIKNADTAGKKVKVNFNGNDYMITDITMTLIEKENQITKLELAVYLEPLSP